MLSQLSSALQCLYPAGSYIASNSKEMWAEGSQIWFEATRRTDVTGGVTSRQQLRVHDPRLAALLASVYGDGGWRYDWRQSG